jgi:hypothetical protein
MQLTATTCPIEIKYSIKFIYQLIITLVYQVRHHPHPLQPGGKSSGRGGAFTARRLHIIRGHLPYKVLSWQAGQHAAATSPLKSNSSQPTGRSTRCGPPIADSSAPPCVRGKIAILTNTVPCLFPALADRRETGGHDHG